MKIIAVTVSFEAVGNIRNQGFGDLFRKGGDLEKFLLREAEKKGCQIKTELDLEKGADAAVRASDGFVNFSLDAELEGIPASLRLLIRFHYASTVTGWTFSIEH